MENCIIIKFRRVIETCLATGAAILSPRCLVVTTATGSLRSGGCVEDVSQGLTRRGHGRSLGRRSCIINR